MVLAGSARTHSGPWSLMHADTHRSSAEESSSARAPNTRDALLAGTTLALKARSATLFISFCGFG